MSESERDMRDLLVAISTKIDVVINRQDDHEGRIRDLYQRIADLPKKSELLTLSQRLPEYVTKSELKAMRTHTITVISVVVVIVGGIVGLVTGLT
ncbi:hypothetical protein [Nocardiopsis sp. YSL2]|uniref:hypothetical protein n=1 Tax=Nocardiopsis sp. YSL2 TaxID=2939492 RepID=UPI0026F42B4D|nr:hypothetical protein [Nocardiopsis sp. YSL2]